MGMLNTEILAVTYYGTDTASQPPTMAPSTGQDTSTAALNRMQICRHIHTPHPSAARTRHTMTHSNTFCLKLPRLTVGELMLHTLS